MEAKLQHLIERIKTDGIEEAENQSRKIIAEAEEKAEKIIKEARVSADSIIENAKKEAVRTEEAGVKALEQASRNSLLSFRESIIELFNRLVHKEVIDTLGEKTLSDMLGHIAANWDHTQSESQKIEVLIGEKDAEILTNSLIARFQGHLMDGVTFKPSKFIDYGFRIGQLNGDMHYDFTDTGLMELLSQHLTPKLAEILKKSV
ncbi:MAG: hypothetical protein JW882_09505 [Deltaproteobacteria bacterium]|nr:hypothetical protein [Deltaproteobacteria bacterium]